MFVPSLPPHPPTSTITKSSKGKSKTRAKLFDSEDFATDYTSILHTPIQFQTNVMRWKNIGLNQKLSALSANAWLAGVRHGLHFAVLALQLFYT
jgi:hypothetical protein